MTDCWCLGCGARIEPHPTMGPPGFPRCMVCSREHGEIPHDAKRDIMKADDPATAYRDHLDARAQQAKAAAVPRTDEPALLSIQRPAGMAADAWFRQVLDESFLPSSPRMVVQWKALAKDFGRATTWDEAAACVRWCALAARKRGAPLKYAEDGFRWAERWAELRAAQAPVEPEVAW